MAEVAIFTEFVNSRSETDSLFVSMSTETELSVLNVKAIRLEIAEVFSSGSPIVSFEFIDGNGDFVNHLKPNPSTKYYLDIGRSALEATRIELRCSKIVMVNGKTGSAEQVSFKMFFVHHGWNNLINKRVSRGWKDKKTSEIVTEILEECEYKEIEVSESVEPLETFIQPYWSNLQTIRYLRKKTDTENGGHVEFGCTIDGKFFFKSVGDLIEEQKEAAKSRDIPIFKMEGQISEEVDRLEAYKKNKNTPTYLAHFTGEESYLEAILAGAGGVTAMYYDSEEGQFIREPIKYSDIETVQLSDWTSVQEEHELATLPQRGGREQDIILESKNKVTDIINSMSRLEIISEGCPNLHIGTMVEVIIPTPVSIMSIQPQNILYSGFYLVSGVKHVITFKNSTLTSAVSLMREGFDGKDLEGYVKSTKGKFL